MSQQSLKGDNTSVSCRQIVVQKKKTLSYLLLCDTGKTNEGWDANAAGFWKRH